MAFDNLLISTMTVQRATQAASLIGSNTVTWADHLTSVRCRVQPVGGSEKFSLAKYNVRITHVIYCRVADITERDRIYFDSRYFLVRVVRNMDECDSFLTLLCEEAK